MGVGVGVGMGVVWVNNTLLTLKVGPKLHPCLLYVPDLCIPLSSSMETKYGFIMAHQ